MHTSSSPEHAPTLCYALHVHYADCNGITATAVAKLVYSPNDPMALLAVDDKYSFSSSITIPTARGVLVNEGMQRHARQRWCPLC
jgi:hypothetical protein